MICRKQFLVAVGLFFGANAWTLADKGERNHSPHFNTGIRVLLQRSIGTAALRSIQPATVRVSRKGRAARLTPGLLFLRPIGEKIQMVRIPYAPRTVDRIDMSWPEATPGFEVDGITFRGDLRIRSRHGELFLVNHLPLETYLAGSVGKEMNAAWSLEALKAQSVAARSYALYRKARPRHQLFDLDRTTQDQVYSGSSAESEKSRRAVWETEGLFLSDTFRPRAVFYHSRCGGDTEDAHGVWGNASGTNPSAPCIFCRNNPYKWNAKWSLSEFAQKLGLPSANMELRTLLRASTGRVARVQVLSGGKQYWFSGETLRRYLGYGKLKSARFEFALKDGRIWAEGTGFGHGVGMCQWGAKALAEKGEGFRKILSHFYPQLRIQRWDIAAEKRLDSEALVSVSSRPRRTRRPDWEEYDAKSFRLRFSSAGGANRQAPRLAP